MQEKEGSLKNVDEYVRIQTNATGFGAYEFYFSTPPLLVDDAPKPTVSLVVVAGCCYSYRISCGRGSRYLTRHTSRRPPSGMRTIASS